MRIRSVLLTIAVLAVVSALASTAQAQGYSAAYEPIDTHGARPFVYHGYAYVPLQSTADYVGASVSWRGDRGDIRYHDRDFAIEVGSTRAYYAGQPVYLPIAPVRIGDDVMVPSTIFGQYLDVDLEWQPDRDQIYVMGTPGWGYYDVLPYAPDYALAVLQGPGFAVGLGVSPFFYGGMPYVPFYDWCGFFGIPVFFEPDYDDFVGNFEGTEFVLAIGERRCFFGDRDFDLGGSVVIVNNQIFVPMTFFADTPIHATVQRTGDTLLLRAPTGERRITVAARPPATIATTLPANPRRLGIPVKPATIPGVVTRAPRFSAPVPGQARHMVPPPPRATQQPMRPAPPAAERPSAAPPLKPMPKPQPKQGPPAVRETRPSGPPPAAEMPMQRPQVRQTPQPAQPKPAPQASARHEQTPAQAPGMSAPAPRQNARQAQGQAPSYGGGYARSSGGGYAQGRGSGPAARQNRGRGAADPPAATAMGSKQAKPTATKKHVSAKKHMAKRHMTSKRHMTAKRHMTIKKHMTAKKHVTAKRHMTSKQRRNQPAASQPTTKPTY